MRDEFAYSVLKDILMLHSEQERDTILMYYSENKEKYEYLLALVTEINESEQNENPEYSPNWCHYMGLNTQKPREVTRFLKLIGKGEKRFYDREKSKSGLIGMTELIGMVCNSDANKWYRMLKAQGRTDIGGRVADTRNILLRFCIVSELEYGETIALFWETGHSINLDDTRDFLIASAILEKRYDPVSIDLELENNGCQPLFSVDPDGDKKRRR